MFGFKSPEAKKMMLRAIIMNFFTVLIFFAFATWAFVFEGLPKNQAIAGLVALMVLNTVLFVPAILKARRLENEYEAMQLERDNRGETGDAG